jgi:hypothetical protein
VLKLLLTVTLACGAAAPAAAQGGQSEPPVYVIEYSSAPMIRNAALIETAVRLAERGFEWTVDKGTGDLFTRRSAGGVVARAGQTAFAVLLEGMGATVVHEYGHVARVEERGGSARAVIRLSGAFIRGTLPPLAPAERLSIIGGGFEGSAVLAGRTGDRIHSGGTATPGDLTLLVWNAIASQRYILTSLSDSRLSSPPSFFTGGPFGRPGDPADYAFYLAAVGLSRTEASRTDGALFAETQSIGRRIRRDSSINFVDFELGAAAFGLSRDFIQRGVRRIPVRWLNLGPVSLSPGLRYTLTTNGPERQVRSRYKVGGRVGQAYVRWSDALAPGGTRLLGGGGDYQLRELGGFRPTMRFDVWRNPDSAFAEATADRRETTVRTEIATVFRRSPADRFVLSGAVGAKGRGYLQGYPLAAGAYFNLGGGFRF